MEDLNSLTPDELIMHFAGVSVSPHEDGEDHKKIISTATMAGFRFKDVTLPDVTLTISRFSSQVCGEDGIPRGVFVKALPIIGEHMVRLFNSPFAQGVFLNL